MWQRGGTKGDFSSPFLAESGSGERGERILKKLRVFRKRKYNFSLDFPVFGLSDLVGPRSKVVLCCKGYARAPVL